MLFRKTLESVIRFNGTKDRITETRGWAGRADPLLAIDEEEQIEYSLRFLDINWRKNPRKTENPHPQPSAEAKFDPWNLLFSILNSRGATVCFGKINLWIDCSFFNGDHLFFPVISYLALKIMLKFDRSFSRSSCALCNPTDEIRFWGISFDFIRAVERKSIPVLKSILKYQALEKRQAREESYTLSPCCQACLRWLRPHQNQKYTKRGMPRDSTARFHKNIFDIGRL